MATALLEHLRKQPRRRLAAIAIASALAAVIACWRSGAFATPPGAAPAPAVDPNAAPAATDPSAEPAVPADPTKVQVVFATMPPSHATVRWGKALLGKIKPRQPLVITRPRDSGPLDVVIRAPGYLPVQTRAHTFSDTRLLVKLTPLDQKSTLLGYRAPLDAGLPFGGDGGVPETLSDMPSSLTNPSITPAPGMQPVLPQPQPALPQPQPQLQPQPQPLQPQPQPQPVQPQPAPPAR